MSSAASYVDQINTEYHEVVKAEKVALPHAIKCGELLNLAKENVKAEKMKWGEWIKVNCPDIAQETASLYMRLAEHKKLVAKAKSIREARDLLPKKEPRGATKEPEPDVEEPDFEQQPDQSLEDELQVLAPDELCRMLVETWDDDQLAQLAKMIGVHLEKKKSEISNAVTNSPSPAPSVAIRR
jgi:hypothetical protein